MTVHKQYVRTRNEHGIWFPWVQLAMAESPILYDLPLVSGFIARHESKYFKTQENVVTVYLSVQKADGSTIPNSTIIANLPEGFRPAKTFIAPVSGAVPITSTTKSGHMYVTRTGEIVAYIDTTGANAAITNVSFVAS